MLQTWRQNVAARGRVTNVSSPVTPRISDGLSQWLEFEYGRAMVCRCGRVSISPVYVGRQTNTEDWGEVVVEQR
jgi:hypothetical protein